MAALTLALVGAALTFGVIQASPIRLWTGDAPGALGQKDQDTPTLTVFKSEKPNGTAIVIFPGGGYGGLAEHEGKGYADYLVTQGITCFVLKYRLGSAGYRHPVMLNDAARAVRLVRSRADEFGVKPDRIGVMGSSAGGHLASTIATHFDGGNVDSTDPIQRVSSRPDFAVLCYAVITMGKYTHQGSKNNLLGQNPPQSLVDELSNELRVTSDTPPCFVWHTVEDQAVPVENSMQFAAALRANKVPFELHLYEKGGHGIGLADGPPFNNVHPWAKDLIHWLKDRKLMG